MAMHLIEHGAQDCIIKSDVNPHLLTLSIRYALKRKQIETKLDFERYLLHTLMDNIPDRIFFKDRESKFVRINKAMAEAYGLESPEEGVGKSLADFVSGATAKRAREDEVKIMFEGKPLVDRVDREIVAGKENVWLLTHKVPMRNRYQVVVGTLGISRDVTRMKNMERELSSERHLLRSLIDNFPDPIYIMNSAGCFMLGNQATADFFGVGGPQELEGKRPHELFPKDLADPVVEGNEIIIKGAKPK